jgi:hypothetical protein
MAIKTFYATRDLKNPSYGTRMLRAGDPVELDAPKARLYLALGAVSPTRPSAAAKVAATRAPVSAPPPAAPTKAPAKRKPRKATKKGV